MRERPRRTQIQADRGCRVDHHRRGRWAGPSSQCGSPRAGALRPNASSRCTGQDPPLADAALEWSRPLGSCCAGRVPSRLAARASSWGRLAPRGQPSAQGNSTADTRSAGENSVPARSPVSGGEAAASSCRLADSSRPSGLCMRRRGRGHTCAEIDPLLGGFDEPIMIEMPLSPTDVPHLVGVSGLTSAASAWIGCGK